MHSCAKLSEHVLSLQIELYVDRYDLNLTKLQVKTYAFNVQSKGWEFCFDLMSCR